jgi:preprotein translocase subunit SecF
MTRPDSVVAADQLKVDYFNQSDAVQTAEVAAAYQNSTVVQQTYHDARAKLDVIATHLFNVTGNSNLSPSNYNSTRALDAAVNRAYADFNSGQNTRLRAILSAQIPESTASINEVTSALGSDFLQRAIMVVFYSMIFTSITVFVIFRTFTPSVAVLCGAAADVLIAMGAMAVLHIPLTLASFAALMMLIGFSLDTDVLLTMRVLKRHEGHAADRAYDAMKTGLTMSLSSIVAMSALMVLALTTHIAIYYEIAAVALAGLVGDVVATWCFNAVIILHYMEEQEKKGGAPPAKPLISYIFQG